MVKAALILGLPAAMHSSTLVGFLCIQPGFEEAAAFAHHLPVNPESLLWPPLKGLACGTTRAALSLQKAARSSGCGLAVQKNKN